MTTEYDKLVRDRIPEAIEAEGERPVVHVADDEEFERRLGEKLEEELAEFREERAIEELADALEVVYAIADREGVSRERLEQLRREKAERRGRFERGIVLERVES